MQYLLESGERGAFALHPLSATAGWLGGALVGALLGLLYFAFAVLGLKLTSAGVAVLWPASGLAAGTLIALGPGARLPVALAIASGTIAANLMVRDQMEAAVAFAVSNVIECLIIASLVERYGGGRLALESFRGVVVLLTAAGLATALAAIPAAITIKELLGERAVLGAIWRVWFEADAVGVVAVAPLVLALPAIARDPPDPRRLVEGSLLLLALAIIADQAFGMPVSRRLWSTVALFAFVFVLLLVIAARMPSWFSALAILVVAATVAATTLAGSGQLTEGAVAQTERMRVAQIAIVIVTLCSLTLAAVFAEQRSTMTALESSQERLLLALDSAALYVFDHDARTSRVRRTGQLIEALGLPATGNMSEFLDRVHPHDRPSFEAMFEAMSPAEPYQACQIRMRTPDGSYMWIGYRARALFDDEGRRIGVRGGCADITKPMQAARALRENEERLRQAFAAGGVFAFDWDPQSDRVKRSESALAILGISPAQLEMTRAEFVEQIDPDDRLEYLGLFAALSPADPGFSARFRFRRSDGRTVWLEVTALATFTAEGRLTGLSGLARDITELKLAEARQTRLISELNHRVKNTLARIDAMIDRTSEFHGSVEDFTNILKGRIEAMTRVHKRLSRNQWDGVSIAELIRDEIEPYRTEANSLVAGPEIVLSPVAAQAVSLTMHELATNAAKHGALSRSEGRTEVTWKIEREGKPDALLTLLWKESAESRLAAPDREGFGLSTIRNLLCFELDGKVELEFRPEGVQCAIELPIERIAATPRLDC